jgi:hypothetical protein
MFAARRSEISLQSALQSGSEAACAKAFDERVHPAVDAAFGGNRPPGEPVVNRLEVLHAWGTALRGAEV